MCLCVLEYSEKFPIYPFFSTLQIIIVVSFLFFFPRVLYEFTSKYKYKLLSGSQLPQKAGTLYAPFSQLLIFDS